MEKQLEGFKSSFDNSKSRTMLSGGVIFTYLATAKETNGQFTMFEAKGIPGMEPPPHIHAHEDEAFYILDGELLFTIGEKEFHATAGDYIFMPRNVRHQFKVLSARFHSIVSIFPGGLEDYFEPLSMPYSSDEIPLVNTSPPPKEALEMMEVLNEKFGIRYLE